MRLDPDGSFGLLEIAGVRIVSEVLGETLWEMLGKDLVAGVKMIGGAQILPHPRRLRLLCAGDDAQVRLPDVDLRGVEEPLVLEIGVRVRTELASIGHTLQESARDIQELASLRADNERFSIDLERERADHHRTTQAVAEWQLNERATRAELEAALTRLHSANEQVAALQAAVEAARTDGRQQVTALNEQLITVRAESQAQLERWTAELSRARAHGDERAGLLAAEIESLRHHVVKLEAVSESTGHEMQKLHEEIIRSRLREESLRQETFSLNQHAERRETELTSARQAEEENRGRVRSMQNSLSWKLTLPLRVLNRALTGRRPGSKVS